MFLTYIFLMASDNEHFFTSLFASVYPIYSLWWNVSSCLVCFLIGLFGIFSVEFENSLHSLDTSPLLNMWLTNIFSQSTACLFSLSFFFFGFNESSLWCMGLVATQHMESSWTRDWTHFSCTERQILYHWATRKSSLFILYFNRVFPKTKVF